MPKRATLEPYMDRFPRAARRAAERYILKPTSWDWLYTGFSPPRAASLDVQEPAERITISSRGLCLANWHCQ